MPQLQEIRIAWKIVAGEKGQEDIHLSSSFGDNGVGDVLSPTPWLPNGRHAMRTVIIHCLIDGSVNHADKKRMRGSYSDILHVCVAAIVCTWLLHQWILYYATCPNAFVY